jgi:ferredoxin-NADP reductase
MVVNKSVSSLLDLLEWRDHCLAADALTVNYNICHPEFNERGTKVKSIERKQMSSESITYLVKLKNRFSVAERTTAFQFEKPTNFIFRPGQWIDITLLNPAETDAEGNVRGFSIASAPYEQTLMVATRMRDTAFKRELAKVPLDTEVKIVGPGGNLTLHNNSARTAVFLAGGIGVTPIRSIVFHAAKQRLPHRIFFFFSNRRPEDAPFLADLQALQKENPNYTCIPTMTEMAKSHHQWSGETGYINEEMMAKYLGAAKSPIYYIVGPPKMVSGLHRMINESGIDDDDIRTEDFSGY